MADMDDDNDTNEPDDDADDQEGAIPTSDSTDDPASMQDDTGGQTGAAGVTGAQPAPGAAQSPGSALSQLLALVRAVQSYGMKQAMQQGDATQQAASFEDGGSTTPEEDDTTGAIPTAAAEGPQDPDRGRVRHPGEGARQVWARRRVRCSPASADRSGSAGVRRCSRLEYGDRGR